MPPDFEWRAHAVSNGLMACAAIIAPTRAFALALAGAYGVAIPHVVWNGRGAAPARAGPRASAVLTAGRLWDEGKNVRVLDAAAAVMSAPLLAAGPLVGPNGARAELTHAKPLGRLSPRQMADRLRSSAIFSTAALYEPFGLGVLEAAQAGCALVLSDIPTLRELWEGAALFAHPREPAAFAHACEHLLGSPAERDRLSHQARRRAARYSTEAMCSGVLEIYRRFSPVFGPIAEEAAA